MAMDAAELGRWMRFATKGGIGRCVAVRDCEARELGDLMFLEGDEIIVLHQLPSSKGAGTSNSTSDSTTDDTGGGTQFLGYCEEIVGRFNASDVRFMTRLKKAVMTKRVSASAAAPATQSSTTSAFSSSPVPGFGVSNGTGGAAQSPTMSSSSPAPSTVSTAYTNSGNTNSPRASPAPSTFSTVSSSTQGIHEPRIRSASTASTSGFSTSAPKSGLGLGMGAGMGMSGGVSDTLERRSSAAASASATRTASPLQRSYTSPSPSIPPLTSASNSVLTSVSGTSTLTSSPTTSSFVSFSPSPSSSVTSSPREVSFPPSISSSSASAAPSSSAGPATKSASYSTSNSARNSPSPSLHHSHSLGSTSTSSSMTSISAPSSPVPSSPSPRMQSQPLQPHSQQQHRYTAHAPSPLSFATASALSQRVSSTSASTSASPSFSRSSSYSRSSSAGTPTSPAFSAVGTLSPTSPSFSTSSLSMSPPGLGAGASAGGGGGLTPTAASTDGSLTPTNPLRITKRSPSLGHATVHSVIPGLRSPPPVSPLPELPASASTGSFSGTSGGSGGVGGSSVGSGAGSGSGSTIRSETEPESYFAAQAPAAGSDDSLESSRLASRSTSRSAMASNAEAALASASMSSSSSPPSISTQLSVPASTSTPSPVPSTSHQPSYPAVSHPVSLPPPLDLPSITEPTPPSPNTAPPTSMTTSTESPMNSSYAARMAFTPLPSSIGGFGAIAGHAAEDSLSFASAVSRGDEKDVMKLEAEAQYVQANVREGNSAEMPSLNDAPSTTMPVSTTANDVGLSLLQLQDLADGMYSYGSDSDSDSDSHYSSNSYEGAGAGAGAGVSECSGSVAASGDASRSGSRNELTKMVEGVGVVDRNGRRKSLAPGSSGKRATLHGSTFAGLGGTAGNIGVDVGKEDREDAGSEDGTVEGVAYYSLGADADVDEEEKALLAKMEAMNAMVAAMPAFPTKPSPGVVARSAIPPSPSTSAPMGSSLGSGGGSGGGTHLSPASPTFSQDTSERQRRPSIVSAYSARSVHSVQSAKSAQSGASGTSATSGSGEYYDIYDSYRYSRYSVHSGRSGVSNLSGSGTQAHIPTTSKLSTIMASRAGGKRMDSMGSVNESYEDEQVRGSRGLDMVLGELSFGETGTHGDVRKEREVMAEEAEMGHERTMSMVSEASVYTQDSSEQTNETKMVNLGVSAGGSGTIGTPTAVVPHATASRPMPLDLSKNTSNTAKSVTSPLLHTSWGSAASSSKSSAYPFEPASASFGVQAQNLAAARTVERAEVEERVTNLPLDAITMRQQIEDDREGEEGDRTVSTIMEGAGLGQRIVIEDDEELPSRIEDDGLDVDDTMTSTNTRRSSASGSPEPESNILRPLAPMLVVANRTPSPTGGDADESVPTPVAVPRPPRSAGLSPFAASNQRRSIFLPHPGAPKAPSQVDNDGAEHQLASRGSLTEPAARLASSPPPHDMQHIPLAHQYPQSYSSPVPIPRPTLSQMIQLSLTTPPRPPPPILQGMKLTPAPLMKGPTIYGRTDVDIGAAVGPVPISWSIDPFPMPLKPSNTGSGKNKIGGGVVGQNQSLPAVGVGRGYPTRSMSMGPSLGASAVSSTSSPLAKSASTSPPPPVTYPVVSTAITSMSLAPLPLLEVGGTGTGAGGTGGALPRANFVPRAPGLRPRSRSFSGFNATNSALRRPGDVKRSQEAPSLSSSSSTLSTSLSIRASDTSIDSSILPLSSSSSTTTLTSSRSIDAVASSSSLVVVSSPAPSSVNSALTSASKPPIPTAPKPIPKPPSTLTSKKPSSLSLRSSPLSTSLSVGGGLKSPKTPSSPLAMNVVVAQRDSVVSVSDIREGGGGDYDEKTAPDLRQLRLRAMGSMPNLGSSSTSFSSTLSPPSKSPSLLSLAASSTPASITSDAMTRKIPDKIDTASITEADVRNMSSPISAREPRSPPPFAGLPLLVSPDQHRQTEPRQQGGPLSPVSPSTPTHNQAGFLPSQTPSTQQGKPQRQTSLRSKLSLPNLRRKQSRPEVEDGVDRDFQLQSQFQSQRDLQSQHLPQRDFRDRDLQRDKEDQPLDIERERELLQVRDLEFELVRPSLPAAQREWGAARTSEDSGVLGRDTASFEYSNPGNGPFRGGGVDANSRASFESRGSLDIRNNYGGGGSGMTGAGASSGSAIEGSRLRPTSPALSVVSGAPSSMSLSRQRSPTIDAPWSSQAESPNSNSGGNNSGSPAEMEAHRARELRWLSLLSSSPSSAGAVAYTLPPSNPSSSAAPAVTVNSAYTPNPLAKSRKTRKLLLESSVPSSVRFRVWVFLTDARARAVPGVYNGLVARGVGRVRQEVAERVRQDVRVEWEKLSARASSPSLVSRSSVSHAEGNAEEEIFSAAKPFTSPSGTTSDAPVTTLLLAYLNMVPDISYFRGLIHVLGHLLLLSPDEDAFWIFISVMDSWLRGYFVVLSGNGMVNGATAGATIPVAPQMDVDALLFTRALEANEPQVAKRLLMDVGLSGVAICGPWFSSVFVGTLPVDHLNRVWDLFLFDGIPLLIRVGIALISCLKRHLLAPLPLASSISASSSSSSPSSSTSSSQSPHATTLLSLLYTPPLGTLPSSPDAFISMALAVKLKDDDVRKQRIKMEQQVSLKMRQQQQASSSSSLAPPGQRPGSLRGSFQVLRAGAGVISLPRAAS